MQESAKHWKEGVDFFFFSDTDKWKKIDIIIKSTVL